jgi:hypothetical protein
MSRSAVIAIAGLLLLVACGGESPEQGADGAAPGSSPPPARPQLRRAPIAGPPGTQVSLTYDGLLMSEPLDIGFGDQSQHVILGQAQADAEGNLVTTVTIPADAATRTQFLFAQNSETGTVVAAPTPFVVTAADGKVTLSGEMTEDGTECQAMHGDAGEIYTLTGADDWPVAGARVRVTGTIAEMSICQQGITIAVESIEALK